MIRTGDPQFSANIRIHIDAVLEGDPFHVSAAIYREGMNAHLTETVALAEKSPAGLLVVREVSWPIVDLRVRAPAFGVPGDPWA